jgi:hypothetical protein
LPNMFQGLVQFPAPPLTTKMNYLKEKWWRLGTSGLQRSGGSWFEASLGK